MLVYKGPSAQLRGTKWKFNADHARGYIEVVDPEDRLVRIIAPTTHFEQESK